ncbi:MAG: nucleotidyltransferase family protein [Clostridiales bacterium]|nr:nucleotidyltransferase family protein [Clostridiales bacterium]
MRVIGIIAEFNPFHSGHEYLIQEARKIVADPRAIVMPVISGPFTQRGLPSLLPAQIRARQAMACGADLVLQLPFTFACAPSSRFAYGGVSELISTGVVTDIAFGIDSGSPEVLRELAKTDFEASEEYREALRTKLDEGLSFPASRAAAIGAVAGPEAEAAVTGPNSILALEYLTALAKLDKEGRINVIMIERKGGDYSSTDTSGEMPGASAIRNKLICDCAPEYRQSAVASSLIGLMPDASLAVMLAEAGKSFSYIDYGKHLRSALSQTETCADDIAYMGDSLAGYLKNVAADIRPGDLPADDYDGKAFEKCVATKRYTMTRIERALASCVTGQTEQDIKSLVRPLYVRVLGFNREGRYCLKIMRKCAKVPVITNPSDALELYSTHPELKRMSELDMRAAAYCWELMGVDPAREWEMSPVQV